MRLLDRYILRNFLVPFLICSFGFLAIWLVFDFANNLSDFIDGKASARFIVEFYLGQLPQITVICLPVGLLLALLYALSRMSRSNEIIAMLSAGQSLTRLLLPLVGVGVVLSLFSTALNISLAPRAETRKKLMLSQLGKKKKDATLEEQLFRNRSQRRTWYVRKMPMRADDQSVLQGVHITQQDADGNILAKWYAREARFRRAPDGAGAGPGPVWLLKEGKTVEFKPDGEFLSEESWPQRQVSGWSETPWRIASSNVNAQGLSVGDLRDYLRYNADFPAAQLAPYRSNLQSRWALPWGCLVIVFLAGPLGIVQSRRGVLAGVAWAIFLFVASTLSGSLMMAFGEGALVSPFTAAWGSNLFFGAIGLGLLYLRTANREFPRLSRLFRFR